MNSLMLSKSNDPFFNLALETVVFNETKKQEGPKLYLWQNNDVVVIGRFQNPWKECNLNKMEDDGVSLMRRDTGGGAVFHDLQNLCFTFVGSTEEENYREKNTLLVCKALADLGFNAEPSGRNDILIEGEKISGAAFREKDGMYIHHGTILIGTDLNRLANYLQPDKKKLESKGITSVRARVTNLQTIKKDVTLHDVVNALFTVFSQEKQVEKKIHNFDTDYINKNDDLKKEYERLTSWDWRYGKSPEFTYCIEGRFDWGGVEINLNVKKALLETVDIYSDSLDIERIQRLSMCLRELKGKPYDATIFKTHLAKNGFIDISTLF